MIRTADEYRAGLSDGRRVFYRGGAVKDVVTDPDLRVAARLRAGQVKINGARTRDHIRAPFGGYKRSGIGRELGPFGLDEFLEIKAVLT